MSKVLPDNLSLLSCKSIDDCVVLMHEDNYGVFDKKQRGYVKYLVGDFIRKNYKSFTQKDWDVLYKSNVFNEMANNILDAELSEVIVKRELDGNEPLSVSSMILNFKKVNQYFFDIYLKRLVNENKIDDFMYLFKIRRKDVESFLETTNLKGCSVGLTEKIVERDPRWALRTNLISDNQKIDALRNQEKLSTELLFSKRLAGNSDVVLDELVKLFAKQVRSGLSTEILTKQEMKEIPKSLSFMWEAKLDDKLKLKIMKSLIEDKSIVDLFKTKIVEDEMFGVNGDIVAKKLNLLQKLLTNQNAVNSVTALIKDNEVLKKHVLSPIIVTYKKCDIEQGVCESVLRNNLGDSFLSVLLEINKETKLDAKEQKMLLNSLVSTLTLSDVTEEVKNGIKFLVDFDKKEVEKVLSDFKDRFTEDVSILIKKTILTNEIKNEIDVIRESTNKVKI